MCHTDFVQILISKYWCSVHSGTWHLRKVMVNCFTTFIFVHLNKTSHEFWGSWRCACMHCWSWYLRLNNLTASYLFNIYVWSVIRLLLQLISSIIICVTGKGHPKLKKSHAVFFFFRKNVHVHIWCVTDHQLSVKRESKQQTMAC